MLRKISTWFEDCYQFPQQDSSIKCCDYMNCQQEGIYQAPKNKTIHSDPRDLAAWYFFCKDHVRLYNQEWSYYNEMNEMQAQQAYKNDMMWNRQTWPLGQNGFYSPHQYHTHYYEDPFYFVEQDHSFFLPEEQKALSIFGLSFPFSAIELQTAYRQLVKNNHPDLNQTKDSEEKIRNINQAYEILKKMVRL